MKIRRGFGLHLEVSHELQKRRPDRSSLKRTELADRKLRLQTNPSQKRRASAKRRLSLSAWTRARGLEGFPFLSEWVLQLFCVVDMFGCGVLCWRPCLLFP